MPENVVLFLLGQLIIACGVYAAIRADLREHSVRISALEKNCERRSDTPNLSNHNYRRLP